MSSEETTRPVILIIEDDESISEIVSRVLESEGYTTHIAWRTSSKVVSAITSAMISTMLNVRTVAMLHLN